MVYYGDKFYLLQLAHEKQSLAFFYYAQADKQPRRAEMYNRYADVAAKDAENFYSLARKTA